MRRGPGPLFAPPPSERPELKLYPHQEEVLERIRGAFRAGHKRVLLVMPTGAGKSETAAQMQVLTSLSNGRLPSVFAVHRRTLVDQFSKRLRRYGIPHGVLMAGHEYDLEQKIQVASIDTLDARYFRDGATGDSARLPDFGLIVYDEAHTHPDKAARFFDAYPNAWVIGLTATPAPADGRGLGRYGYTAIVEGPSVSWLMANGYLVGRVRYFGPESYDYSGVKIGKGGEYVESSADEVVNRPELIGNVVEQYVKLGNGEPFVVFANSVAHSRNLANAFTELGYPCAHIDANTPGDEREAAYEALEAGTLRGLSNYGILDRGFDAPRVAVCILARKVRHISTYRQMVGRVLRTHPDKSECRIIDHGGNVAAHGFVDDPVEWTLDGDVDVNERERERREKLPAERKPVTCQECGAVFAGSPRCPECGAELPKRSRSEDVETTGDDLAELTREGVRKAPEATAEEKLRWYAGLLHIARERGYSEGWAAHTYRAKFGVWPAKKVGVEPVPPAPEVRAFAHAKLQAYARRASYARARERRAAA
ncbi:MAG TPA: DEAD/DEAH box helicase family protein [Longimicrobiales bacterium]